MAFTQSPVTSTYSTERIPAAYGIDLRFNSATGFAGTTPIEKDAGMVNLIPIKDPKTKALGAVTRPPIIGRQVGTETGVPRGLYVWQKTSANTYYFAVFGTKVYTSTDSITWTNVTTFITSASNPVGFTEYIDSTNVKKLILVDGIEGYVFTDNTAGTKITDVDFPSPHLPFPVFIDGYLFLAKKETGDIYNSNLNDPALWTAGDFISSELYPDDIQAIVKVNNYLLAIGTQGSEYFYDAANATGSPLARYEGGSLPFGTFFPYSIAVNKNTVVLLANNNDGEPSFKIIEDFKYKDINNTWLVNIINTNIYYSNTTSSKGRGYFLRTSGNLTYCFKLNGEESSLEQAKLSNGTFVYNLMADEWSEFRGYSSTSTWRTFSVCFSTFSGSGAQVTYVLGRDAGISYFATFTMGSSGYISGTVQDDIIGNTTGTGPILTEIRTPRLNFDTLNRKTMHRLGISVDFGTNVNLAVLSDRVLNVAWSDNDYVNFTSNVELDMAPNITGSLENVGFPFITQLGSFRERSLRLRYSGKQTIRYRYIEMDINKGQQ